MATTESLFIDFKRLNAEVKSLPSGTLRSRLIKERKEIMKKIAVLEEKNPTIISKKFNFVSHESLLCPSCDILWADGSQRHSIRKNGVCFMCFKSKSRIIK